jgi:phenylpropionate dioxygenase-like ring-hydroxylating dioxygenase large terminal subunit
MGYNICMSTVQTKHYISSDHLNKERAEVLEASWVLAAMSAQLPSANSEWLFEVDRYSIMLVRDDAGKVRAFHNSCLHRGTKLRCHPSPNKQVWKGRAGKSISCPYHGWEYDFKGHLQHIPKGEGISVYDRSKLREYPIYEVSGLIWICLGTPKESAATFLSTIPDVLKKYTLQEMLPIEARDFHFSVNWKISLENALDYYHVSKVHGSTVNAHVQEPPTFHENGWHSLQTLHIAPYRWRTWFDRQCTRRDVYSQQEMSSLHKYFIFPNLVLNVLPYHLTIMQIWPVDERHCIMRYRFCFRQNPSLLEKSRVYASWLASRYILYEDIKIYANIQEGMELSEMNEQPLHIEERGIQHCHYALEQWISNRL